MAAVSAAAARLHHLLSLCVAVAGLLLMLLGGGEASVHEYRGLGFLNKGNAFILHAGSEGLYAPSSPANATTAEDDEDAAAAAVADAFIR
mgnify:CR=1 FL=1|jgi:hypothetical protein